MHYISLYRLKKFIYLQIYMSKALLRILALPSRQTFCSSSMSQVMFSTLSHFGRYLGSVPRAPIITGIILTSEHFQILCSSLLKSWYFSIFSFSLLATLVSNKQTKISDRRNCFSLAVNEALLGASSISYIRVLNNLRPFLIF